MRIAKRGILQVIWVLIVVLGSYGEMLASDFYPYITTTFPIDGYVTNLIVPRRTPEYLFALVGSDGKPKTSDRPGLYCFDISDPARLRQVSYLPIVSPTDMQISPDGRTLFVFSAYFHGNDPKAWYGVRLLNVSDPAKISEVHRIETDVMHARLSVDGSYLFLQERGLTRKKDKDYFFSVYRVSSSASPRLATIVTAPSYSSAYGFYPTPDGKHLLIQGFNRSFVSYNIANPAQPEQEFHISPHLGYPKAIGSNGVMYLAESDELILAKIFPKPAKLGSLSGDFSMVKITHVNNDNSTIYVASLDKAIGVFDVSDPRTPKQVARYNTPAYIGSAISRPGDPLIFVGLIGSIAVIDPSKTTITTERLMAAHKQALRFYSQSNIEVEPTLGTPFASSHSASVQDQRNIV